MSASCSQDSPVAGVSNSCLLLMNGIPFCGDNHVFIHPLIGTWTDSPWGCWGRSSEHSQARFCLSILSRPVLPIHSSARCLPPLLPSASMPKPVGAHLPGPLSSRFSHGHLLCPPTNADVPWALASRACKLDFWTDEQSMTSAAAACRVPRMCLCDFSLSRVPSSPLSAHRTSPPGVHWAARAQHARV